MRASSFFLGAVLLSLIPFTRAQGQQPVVRGVVQESANGPKQEKPQDDDLNRLLNLESEQRAKESVRAPAFEASSRQFLVKRALSLVTGKFRTTWRPPGHGEKDGGSPELLLTELPQMARRGAAINFYLQSGRTCETSNSHKDYSGKADVIIHRSFAGAAWH